MDEPRGLFEDDAAATETQALTAIEEPQPEVEAVTQIRDGLAAAMDAKTVARMVEEIQARVTATKMLKAAMLSMTSPLDWVGQERRLPDGRTEYVPYLQGSGAIKLFHPFGIEVRIKPGRVVAYDDGTYEVVFEGAVRAAALGPNWLPVVGSRWSGDPFFGSRGEKADPGDVRKAALTNWYQNAMMAILGLENMTWEELRAAGINPDQVRRVTWKTRHQQSQQHDHDATASKAPAGEYLAVDIAYKDEENKARLKRLGAKWGPAFGFGDAKVWVLPATDEIRAKLAEYKLAATPLEVKS